MVLEPITTKEAKGPREMGVPETVSWGPPGISVCVPMTIVEPAVMDMPPTMKTGGVGAVGVT
jgi:hypothetical protein